MSERVLQPPSDALVERRTIKLESAGRDWREIGFGLVAAFALVALFGIGMWAVLVLAEALF